MEPEDQAKVDALSKRLDDAQAWMRQALATIAMIFSVLGIVFTFNANAEKTDLRERSNKLERDVREQLGALGEPPVVKLYDANNVPLEGAHVEAQVETTAPPAPPPNPGVSGPLDARPVANPPTNPLLKFAYILRNEGRQSTGPIFIKVYTKEPLRLFSPSTDEKGYAYEHSFPPASQEPSSLPAGTSIYWITTVPLQIREPLRPGRHDALMKVYYGANQSYRAPFTLEIAR
jgi:hypothetical protein